MSRRLRLILIFCFCIAFITCGDSEPRELTESEMKLVEADNRFGMKLFREIVNEENDKNIFISPLSVAMALGIAYNGAAGNTQEAMQQTLELTDMTIEEVNEAYEGLIGILTDLDSDVDFRIANSLWHKDGLELRQTFLDICKTYYNALVKGVDFSDPASIDIINDWVNENTNGKITEIIKEINPYLLVLLLNAIYFKGTWTYQFDREETKDGYFTLSDGSEKLCKMMVQEGAFQYFSNADFQAIDLPYGDGYFSMTVFLPLPEKYIDSVIADFNEDNWNQWLSSFTEQDVVLEFPKFTFEYELLLNEVLMILGMGIAFGDGADFTNMFKDVNVPISTVKHKTYVKVDEEGTEAAAVTSVDWEYGGPTTMRINRPFFFVIRDNHSQILHFVGKIVEPILE